MGSTYEKNFVFGIRIGQGKNSLLNDEERRYIREKLGRRKEYFALRFISCKC